MEIVSKKHILSVVSWMFFCTRYTHNFFTRYTHTFCTHFDSVSNSWNMTLRSFNSDNCAIRKKILVYYSTCLMFQIFSSTEVVCRPGHPMTSRSLAWARGRLLVVVCFSPDRLPHLRWSASRFLRCLHLPPHQPPVAPAMPPPHRSPPPVPLLPSNTFYTSELVAAAARDILHSITLGTRASTSAGQTSTSASCTSTNPSIGPSVTACSFSLEWVGPRQEAAGL
jgi:hypothetical protein